MQHRSAFDVRPLTPGLGAEILGVEPKCRSPDRQR
jgi:hypothetical protein